MDLGIFFWSSANDFPSVNTQVPPSVYYGTK